MINEVLKCSKQINNGRTVTDVMATVMEEVGEMATEVRIKYGQSYKSPGPDGIQGEAIDAIAALVDLIYVNNPDITQEEILTYLDVKLRKWVSKESEESLKSGKD